MRSKFRKLLTERGNILIIAVVIVIVILSVVDISVKTNTVSTSSSTSFQSELNTLVNSDSPHYNYRIGYVNFTMGQKEITYGYFLRPFNGWNPVYAGPINYSRGDAPNNLVNVEFVQIAPHDSSTPSSVPFIVSNVTLISPQGMGKTEVWQVPGSNSIAVFVNTPGQYIQSFTATYSLGQYPGYHTFYLNFTLTIYSTFGPYKFPSQSKDVNLEYNNTIIV